MKILQVASHQNITRGGAVQMVRLARGLRERGEEVDLVFNGGGVLSGELKRLEEEGFKVRLFPMERMVPKEMLRFRRLVLEEGYQVVHAHRDPALRFAFFSLLGTDTPLVAQRGTTYRPKGLVRLMLRSPRVRLIVSVAHAVGRSLEEHGVSSRKIQVVYGSADPEEFSPKVSGGGVRAQFSIASEEFVVGTVAALVGKKGYPDLLAAVGALSRRFKGLRLLAVGRGRPEKFREHWEPLSSVVVFTGHRDDVAECMAAMDVVVSASTKGEGLTGALREAMFMGRPVVSTRVSGNPEVVLQGKTGLLVEVGDRRGLASAVEGLLLVPALRTRLGLQGRRLALRLFTHRFRTGRMVELYREVAVG